MKTRRRTRWGLMLGALLWLSPVTAISADVDKGKEVANTCVACHGMDGAGQAQGKFPRLDILAADYITKQLHDFKDGKRNSPVMAPFVGMLDDEKMQNVAAYYASQNAQVPAPEEADDALLKRGEQLALRGDWDNYVPSCRSCHGPDNQGVGNTFPPLAGQHASYIAGELKAWQSGDRANDPQNLMLAVAERLSAEDIEAVSAYLAAQPVK